LALEKGNEFTIAGDGSQKRDYLHVEDAAKMLVTLLFSDAQGTFNVVSSKSYALSEVLSMIEQIADKKILVRYAPAVSEKHSICCSNAKLVRKVGIQAHIALDRGLAAAYNQYQ
jgi:nucleoside-diphosphate-sugar epimerase